MRLATWNINSVRLRINLVLDFLTRHNIDVLCLQETKTKDQHFPAEALAEAGWEEQAFRGEKSYNGVAIISRLPLSGASHMNWAGRDDCRHISAEIESGSAAGTVRVHNFYVPAGGDVPRS